MLHLVLSTLKTNLSIYAVNYNVLRIMSGMGGLTYSTKSFYIYFLLEFSNYYRNSIEIVYRNIKNLKF